MKILGVKIPKFSKLWKSTPKRKRKGVKSKSRARKASVGARKMPARNAKGQFVKRRRAKR